MKNKYIILKLNEKEKEVLKEILSKEILEYMFEKNSADFEKKVSKDYDKYSKKYKINDTCEKILNIIKYLER